jgi:hypothetical protein
VKRATESDFVAADYTVGGVPSDVIQMKTRTEGNRCTAGAGWANFSSPKTQIHVANVTNPVQAVVINGVPGAVWLDNGGTLHLFLP